MVDSLDERRLVALAEERKAGNLLIVAFANTAYSEVLLNWLLALERLGIRNHLVISLDPEIHEFLSARSIASVMSEIEGGLSSLWVRRIEIFQILARHGIDFVHSDVDAVWLKDPIPRYFAPGTHDLIASQGTVWPHDIADTRRFVVCCGLFYMRASPRIERLLEEMRLDVQHTRDDQVSLNRLLESHAVRWNIERSSTLHGGRAFLCSEYLIEGESAQTGLRLCVLPHHEFQRLHMPDREAFAKHLLSPKSASEKLEWLEQTGCLFLNPNWRTVSFDGESLWRIMRKGSTSH